MSIKNLILSVNSVMVSNLIHMTVYYKMGQMLLQNAAAILFENAVVVYTK